MEEENMCRPHILGYGDDDDDDDDINKDNKDLVWCPRQNKRIALLSFLDGCHKMRLKD
jgi:hypothetical protein